jgi:predicted nuclease of predicted toxin-antitoxin system
MRFLLDQDVPEDLGYSLRELSHDVVRVRDFLPQDATDLVVLQGRTRPRLRPGDLQPERLHSIG